MVEVVVDCGHRRIQPVCHIERVQMAILTLSARRMSLSRLDVCTGFAINASLVLIIAIGRALGSIQLTKPRLDLALRLAHRSRLRFKLHYECFPCSSSTSPARPVSVFIRAVLQRWPGPEAAQEHLSHGTASMSTA